MALASGYARHPMTQTSSAPQRRYAFQLGAERHIGTWLSYSTLFTIRRDDRNRIAKPLTFVVGALNPHSYVDKLKL